MPELIVAQTKDYTYEIEFIANSLLILTTTNRANMKRVKTVWKLVK